MGNQCCSNDNAGKEKSMTAGAAELKKDEAMPVLGSAPPLSSSEPSLSENATYKVTLDKTNNGKLGLDVDYMAERFVLPVMAITGGLAEEWNKNHPDRLLTKGDSVVEVNGITGNVATMLEKCKNEKVLEMTLKKALNYDYLVTDLERLITAKNCGPLLIRLSWHDAGAFADNGKLKGGLANAVLRFNDAGESQFAGNAGLSTVGVGLLKPIADKYCPDLISNADLWTLASNVAIRLMGGPDIQTRFGRVDATSSAESVDLAGRLPDGDKGAEHLREIFYPKGFDDKGIVALSGAHTVGKCNTDRSGFEGAWSTQPLVFDNAYFKDLLNKKYTKDTSSKGKPQFKTADGGTIMLISDMALIEDPAFKTHVERYAADTGGAWNSDFQKAWKKLQENGCNNLRDNL